MNPKKWLKEENLAFFVMVFIMAYPLIYEVRFYLEFPKCERVMFELNQVGAFIEQRKFELAETFLDRIKYIHIEKDPYHGMLFPESFRKSIYYFDDVLLNRRGYFDESIPQITGAILHSQGGNSGTITIFDGKE